MGASFKARYFDGKTSQPLEASVEILSEGLQISSVTNPQETILWPAKDLQIMELPVENRPAVIGCKKYQGARLIIAERSPYLAIFTLVPNKNIKHASVATHGWRNTGILLLVSILILIGLLWGIPYASPYLAKQIPADWDDTIGQYVAKNMVQDYEQCVSPQGLKALQKIVDKLSKKTPIQNVLDVKVVQSGQKEINAFAVPGNHIVIFDGLLQYADNPDEVAGVLAHEMGHVIKHHPTEGILRKVGIQLILAGAFGSNADYLSELLHLKYTRENEQQADNMAVILLNQANIDSKYLERFFEKLASESNVNQEEHAEIFQYFSDHPGLLERIQHIQENKIKINATPSLTPQEWNALKNICKKTAPLSFEKTKGNKNP